MSVGGQDASYVPSREEILMRAESLVLVFKERATETDRLRQLPLSNMQELFTSGMLRILQPRRFGGYGMDWATHADAAKVIARGCPSSAWIVSVVGAHAAIVGRLPKVCQEEVWGKNENQLIATASAQVEGSAVKVSNGYRISGIWRFASGVDYAEWLMVSTYVDGNDPNDHTRYLRILIPVKDIEIVDTWHVVGMRGTGSKDIKCSDVFVPERRVINAHVSFSRNPPGAKVNPDSYLYNVSFMPYFGSSLLGPIIGATEGAYETYKSATAQRKGALFGNVIAEQVPVQQRLAESSAEINAACLIYENSNRLLHERGKGGQDLSAAEHAQISRDRAYVARLCVNSVTRLVRQMGAVGLYNDNPVQRYYRDVSAMATQIAVNWDRNMSIFGKFELGLSTGDRLIDSGLSSLKKKQ